MKKITVLLLLLGLLSQAYAETIAPNGFRGFSWGTLRADIIKKEGEPKVEVKNNLLYTGSVAKKEVIILYDIKDNKLVSGGYSFTGKHVNKNLYIDDFEDVKNELIKKYGKPSEDDIDWSNDLYKNDPSDWGKAISYGYLEYNTIWDSENTRIILCLTGDNYEIKLMIAYLSKEHAKSKSNDIDENL